MTKIKTLALALLGFFFNTVFAFAAGIQPTSTYTLSASTTAYASGQLIANSATAGSVIVPSFSLTNLSNSFSAITRGRLQINDTSLTAWPAATIQIDLWSAAPTFNAGDRAAFSVATNTATHLGALSCTLNTPTIATDGYYGECAPIVGNFMALTLINSTPIYWTATATSASGTTTASRTMSFTPEVVN